MDDPTLREGRGPDAVHTRAEHGASPAPATAWSPGGDASGDRADPLAPLKALAAWMRGTGASYVRLPDGTELELGPPPAAPPGEVKPESEDQMVVRLMREMREELRTRYAHVDHEPSDVEVMRALVAGGFLPPRFLT